MSDKSELTEEEVKEVREMLGSYKNYNWLGRLTWKIVVATGAAIAAIAAIKEHLVTIFHKG